MIIMRRLLAAGITPTVATEIEPGDIAPHAADVTVYEATLVESLSGNEIKALFADHGDAFAWAKRMVAKHEADSLPLPYNLVYRATGQRDDWLYRIQIRTLVVHGTAAKRVQS